MPEYKVTGLSERAIGSAEDEHSRGTKRPDHEDTVLVRKPALLEKTNQPYSEESANEGPNMIYRFNDSLPVDDISRNPI
jgi:hypothetical protein